MPSVGFDANLSAFAYNLRRLASLCVSNAELAARAVKAVAASVANAPAIFVRPLLGARRTTTSRYQLAAAA